MIIVKANLKMKVKKIIVKIKIVKVKTHQNKILLIKIMIEMVKMSKMMNFIPKVKKL